MSRIGEIKNKLAYPEYADEIPLEQLEDFGYALSQLDKARVAFKEIEARSHYGHSDKIACLGIINTINQIAQQVLKEMESE